MLKLSTELSILIKAALGGPEDLPILADSDVQPDEAALISLAEWHQVRALLYRYLVGQDNPTTWHDLESLRSYGVGEAIYYMVFLQKSVELNSSFAAQGIKAFLMKGAFWAWLLYDDPGAREFGDIDFFLNKKDIQSGLEVLERHGFKPDAYRKSLLANDGIAEIYFKTDYQLPLKPEQGDFVKSLEIQWNATYPRFAYSFTWEELMSRAVEYTLPGGPIKVPGIDHQLLMMLVHHAGVEQWDKLKYMGDFVRILRKFATQIDWDYVSQVSMQKGFHGLLLESLGMVRLLTGENYFQYLPRDTPQNYPSEKFSSAIFSHWENRRPKPVTKSWRIFYFNFVYRDRLSDKLTIVKRHLSYLMQFRLLMAKAQWYYGKRR
jgi:hypothetical protein